MRTNACSRWRWTAELPLVLLLAAAVAAGCTTAPGAQLVRVAGSDTMLDLNRRLAEAFMRSHPGAAVRVEGGGTGAGVEALIAGEVDLCAASRPFTAEEVAALHARAGTLGVRVLLARDALSVYLHPDNPVRDLSLDELRRVFGGEVASWAALGGRDEPILAVVRPPTSGTHRFFREHVLGGEGFASVARVAARTADVVEAVGTTPGAIGFGGLVFGPGLVHARIDGVAPTAGAVRDGSYPLARYLYYYATAPPSGPTKAFTDWCVTPAGQAVVAETGFIPLWLGSD
jgi:phosphate transport system substrate-binding protein